MIFTPKHPGYKYILALLDWQLVAASFVVAYRLGGHWMIGDLISLSSPVLAEMAFAVIYSTVAVLVFQHLNLYKINVFTTLVDHTVQLAKGVVVLVLGLALLAFFTRAPWIVDSRLALFYFTVSLFGLSLFLRVLGFRKLFIWLSQRQIYQRQILIVGAGETGRNLAVSLMLNEYAAGHVVGFLDDELPLGKVILGGPKVLGRVNELAACVDVFGVDEIIICVEKVNYVHLMELLDKATKTNKAVKIASPLYDVVPARIYIEQYGNVPVVSVAQTGPTPMNEKYKRLFDIVVTAMGALLLSPLFLVIALLIKLDSPGPVFFLQTRIGKNGRPFKFYKFRSMVVGSDQDQTRKLNATLFIRSKRKTDNSEVASTKIVNESRVTRVGQWLRKTSVDELPQLINVLRGEMSLVGPRPCLPYEWEHYEEWHKRRLTVLPGCTGVWQVSGRSAVGFEDMVVLDLYYIQNATLWLDIRLILKTIPVMVFGTGAK
jgi:exopolysaccharide biosynthesis polyprenyl glycosylphosphotransferase